MDFCNLPVEVPQHGRLARQFETMHLGFDVASAVVSAPTSLQGKPQVSLSANRFVLVNSFGTRRLPRLGILARWDHCMGVSDGNGLVAFKRVERPVCVHAADILVRRGLVEENRQHRSVLGVTSSVLDCPNLQRLFVNSDVNVTQISRFKPPCLRVFQSTLPSALMPVLSIEA